MGFDTYLQVDGRTALMWRKHAGNLPRLLFRFEDLHVCEGTDADGRSLVEVEFKTTAGKALVNLERAGLGWGAAVAAYAETRFSGFSAGFVMAGAFVGASADSESVATRMAAFEAIPASEDLKNLGALMVADWHDPGSDDVSLLSQLSYDGSLDEASELAFEVWKGAERRGVPNAGAAARAAESLAFLDRTAPMLVWPLAVCIFLHHLAADAPISLVLTEDAAVSAKVSDLASARGYATSYWATASDSLAVEARTLERLFAVLAGSSVAGGAAFWHARSADLLERLRSINKTADATTRARGDALESLVDALIRIEEPELQVVEKNFRTTEEELDLVLSNGLSDPFWLSFGSPLILVECKNWSTQVGVPEVRILESKMQDRAAMCKIGILVSRSGFARTAKERLKAVQSDVGIIFAVTGDDLVEIVNSKQRVTAWLREIGLRESMGARR